MRDCSPLLLQGNLKTEKRSLFLKYSKDERARRLLLWAEPVRCSLLRSLVRSHRDAMSVIDKEFQ